MGAIGNVHDLLGYSVLGHIRIANLARKDAKNAKKTQKPHDVGLMVFFALFAPLRETILVYPSIRAAGFEKYVKIMPAPARVMEVRLSIIARSWSIQPLRAAATIIEYSPLTW